MKHTTAVYPVSVVIPCYMGYLVLQSADNRAFDIIDGQQRMTTLSLLMLAAVSHLSDLAAPDDPADPQALRAQQLRASYIGYLDPAAGAAAGGVRSILGCGPDRSEFAITRKLAEDYDTWTPDKIRSRQAWMARQATTIWRIDF